MTGCSSLVHILLYICLLESLRKITDKHTENLKQASGEIQAKVRPQNFLGQSLVL